MKHMYLLLCISLLLMISTAWAEPLGSKKREMGKGPRGNTPQMQFFDAAEQDAEDKYATIIDPADREVEVQESQQQEKIEPSPDSKVPQ